MTQRNYAHEIVTDVMHNEIPNLITAQRARDQIERLQEQNAELLKAMEELLWACEYRREHGGQVTQRDCLDARAAIARTQGATDTTTKGE